MLTDPFKSKMKAVGILPRRMHRGAITILHTISWSSRIS